MCMNEMAGVRKKLERALGEVLPVVVWDNEHIQSVVKDYLDASDDAEREDLWGLLEQGARERLDIWTEGRKEGLRGVRIGTLGG